MLFVSIRLPYQYSISLQY